MIKTSMRIEPGDKGEDRLELNFNRVVYTAGSSEQICMDLRTISHGLQMRIKKEAKSKEEEVALRAMYEAAFFDGFRMSGKEIGDMDQEFYDQLVQRFLDGEADYEEIKGCFCS